MIPTISTLPIQHLASGDCLSIQVYQFVGGQSGKKAYLQANLHGAEIAGNAVIYQLIEFLSSLNSQQLTGEIWLVPTCNPLSTNQRSHYFSTGRYNPYDGKDWNRIFWDYEQETNDLAAFAQAHLEAEAEEIRQAFLAKIQQAFAEQKILIDSPLGTPLKDRYRYQLQSLCLDANYVIDLHSSSNLAIDYLYCCQTREESAKAFLLDYGILLDEYDGDAFDEAFIKPWLALEKKLAQLGKKLQFDIESWTLELGSGMQANPESVARGITGIKNYLAVQGMLQIPGFPMPETATHEIAFRNKTQIQKYYAPVGGMIQSRVALGTQVKAGDRLYQLLSFNRVGALPTLINILAQTPGLVADVAYNHAVNEGEYILTLL